MSPSTWSPPSSPEAHDITIVPTDYRGMITDPTQSPSPSKRNGAKPARVTRRALQYVSRHFAQPPTEVKKEAGTKRKRNNVDDKENSIGRYDSGGTDVGPKTRKARAQRASGRSRTKRVHVKAVANEGLQVVNVEAKEEEDAAEKLQHNPHAQHKTIVGSDSEPFNPTLHVQARIVLGINIDELSSDSDLTDVPDEIGPDPFLPKVIVKKRRKTKKQQQDEAEVVAVKDFKTKSKSKKTSLTKSPYFPHPHKPRPTFLSTLPFPPLHHARFGLMQERLHRDPFRLLLATIFLNKTPGARAMPIFFRLMEKYPTPQDLANAEQSDVTEIIQQLGFQNQRARKCIAMAKMWVQDQPVKNRRWRKLGYPVKGDGKDVKEGEVVHDEDERVAWEISHLPGLGPYSHDSWRMFCRDQLRGLSSGYDGEDSDKGFEPEWKRVLPADKELRAWMTWMWMKEGWVWNKETGERTKASEELMALAEGKGNIVLESDNNTLMVKSLEESQPSTAKLGDNVKKDLRVEVPAGGFIPESQNKGNG